jgi:hypothetical protein
MHCTGRCSLMTACALAFAVHTAAAQTTPPMKAGLWQIHVERGENGQKMQDGNERMKERMKNMTPEDRKRVEEMMKQHGVATGEGGVIKLCYSQKMVEHGAWTDQGGCKTEFSNRSATSWKWHSICTEAGYQGDGEATFPDAENFVVKSTGVSTIGGKNRTTSSTRTGKWLAADCGDLKPLDATQ